MKLLHNTIQITPITIQMNRKNNKKIREGIEPPTILGLQSHESQKLMDLTHPLVFI